MSSVTKDDMIDSEAEYDDPQDCDYTLMLRKVGMKPRRPSESDCCHTDCGEACVFERYDTKMDRWRLKREKFVKELKLQQTQK